MKRRPVTWLLIDCSALAHRAMHTTGALKYEGVGPTGVLFGFFAAILDLEREFQTNHVVFCFDRRGSKRKKLCPTYKKKRGEKKYIKEEQDRYHAMHSQILKLRKKWLPKIGYKNVFSQKGYEADDIIASVCLNLPLRDNAIIVSGDEDFYQLLSKRVRIWKPVAKKVYTYKQFRREFLIHPRYWGLVKAIAGCSTDEVAGIVGIGNKTAAAYLNSPVSVSAARRTLIEKHKKKCIRKNLPLVQLPFKGTKKFVPKVDGRLSGWADTFKALGIRSLRQPK